MAANRNTTNTVQADWSVTDESSPAFIKNKPTTKPVVAGSNVTIEEGDESFTISASGGGSAPEYVAGEGITISDDTISVDTDAIQTKLTAGTNIDMTNGIVSTDKTVVAAGDNVTVSSSLDTLNNVVTYTVNATGGSQPSSGLKYAIDESNSVTWNDSGVYSWGMFTFKRLDYKGIEYAENNDHQYDGFVLELGHLYQVNFDCILSYYGYYNKIMKGEIWLGGPLSQHWVFTFDDSQTGRISIPGSFLVRCKSPNETNLRFNIKFEDVLNGSWPTAYMSGISIVDLGLAATE